MRIVNCDCNLSRITKMAANTVKSKSWLETLTDFVPRWRSRQVPKSMGAVSTSAALLGVGSTGASSTDRVSTYGPPPKLPAPVFDDDDDDHFEVEYESERSPPILTRERLAGDLSLNEGEPQSRSTPHIAQMGHMEKPNQVKYSDQIYHEPRSEGPYTPNDRESATHGRYRSEALMMENHRSKYPSQAFRPTLPDTVNQAGLDYQVIPPSRLDREPERQYVRSDHIDHQPSAYPSQPFMSASPSPVNRAGLNDHGNHPSRLDREPERRYGQSDHADHQYSAYPSHAVRSAPHSRVNPTAPNNPPRSLDQEPDRRYMRADHHDHQYYVSPTTTRPIAPTRVNPTPAFKQYEGEYEPPHRFNNPSRGHSVRRQKEPDKFDGLKVEWSDYLKHFQTVAEWNCWSYDEKGLQLAMSLQGEAQRVLGDLRQLHRHVDFNMLVAELTYRYNPADREFAYRMEFKGRMKKSVESIMQYGYALRRLAVKAFPSISTDCQEQLILDQFISGLVSVDIKRHVQFGHPKNLNEAISLAVEYESFHNQGAVKFQKPAQVSSISNKPEDEQVKLLKQLCSSVERQSQELANIPRGNTSNPAPPSNNNHHYAPRNQNLPNTSRPGISNSEDRSIVRCYNCSQSGHISRNCPQKNQSHASATNHYGRQNQGPSQKHLN